MHRELKGSHTLLRFFVGEKDKAEGQPLYWFIMEEARRLGVAGCTCFRGIAGYGASSHIHQDKPFRLSSDLPIVVEIVDTKEHVAKLLEAVDPVLTGALVTEEQIEVRHYSAAKKK
jgi:PII-like signaling protein